MTGAAHDDPGTASSYATGGGGVVLEHRYGAVLLAHLLSGDPMPGLRGDEFRLERVEFQAVEHPVDDFEVTGRSAADTVVRWLLAVRRAPRLIASDHKSVALVSTFLKVVEEEPEALRRGERRLVLVVSGPHPPSAQLAELAELAATSDTAERFGVRAAQKACPIRDRLAQVDRLVALAASDGASSTPEPELTWRLLARLTVHQAELEGAQSLRTQTVGALRPMTATGTIGLADDLFRRLEELADHFAQRPGASLRQSCAGTSAGPPSRDLARSRPDGRSSTAPRPGCATGPAPG